MKGLLLKDLYMTLKYCKPFLFIVVLFTAMSGFVNNSFMFIYPSAFVSLIPFTLGAYDERSKWNVYCDTLPVDRKAVVSSKYVLTLVAILAVILLTTISMSVSMLWEDRFDIRAIANKMPLLLLISTGSTSVLIPVYFKYGAEKARIIYLATVGVVTAVGAGLGIVDDINLPSLSPLFICLICGVVFALSWLISSVIYNKRELY